MSNEIYLNGITTLKDLIKKYPEITELPIVIRDRENYNFIGVKNDYECNSQGYVGTAFIKDEEISVLVFSPKEE